MFAWLNPPRFAKRKKGKGGKRKPSAANKYISKYFKSHKGASLKSAWASYKACGSGGSRKPGGKRCSRRVTKGRKGATKRRRYSPRSRSSLEAQAESYARQMLPIPAALQKKLDKRKGACDLYYMYGGKKPKHCSKSGTFTPSHPAQSPVEKQSFLKRFFARTSDRLPTAAELGYRSVNPRRKSMARRKRHHKRRKGAGGGFLRSLGLNPGVSTHPSLSEGVKPKNYIGVLPVLGGVAANNLLTNFASNALPVSFFKGGLGNYLLGFISARVVGGIAKRVSPKNASSIQLGAYAEVSGRIVNSLISTKSLAKTFGISGLNFESDFNFSGGLLNDFVSPNQIANAGPTVNTQSQYPMPVTGSMVQAADAEALQAMAAPRRSGEAAKAHAEAVRNEMHPAAAQAALENKVLSEVMEEADYAMVM